MLTGGRRWVVWSVIVSLLLIPGCRKRSRRPDPGIPISSTTDSPKLSTFIFQEEGNLYLTTVGVNAARFHDQDSFVPLTVALLNKTGTPIQLTRESFTLVDPVSGARYGLATVNEVRSQGKQFYDRRLMDLDHLASKLDTFRPVQSNFFPSSGLVTDTVEIHSLQFMLDNLYFPRPEGEFLGKTFEFHVNARGLEQPLFVVFTIPEK